MRKKAIAKSVEKAIPQGFQKFTTGSFPTNHDFRAEPVCQGKVIQIKKVPQKRGKKTEEVLVLYVANSDGVVSAVWESHAIADGIANTKPGDEVFIRFNGIQKLKGKKTLKLFDYAVKPGKGKK